MKTILAISAAIFAATPAFAYNYATRTWGDEACRLFRQGYGLERGVRTAGTNVGSSIVLASPKGEFRDYVMATCLTDAMNAYDRDQ